MDWSTIIAAAWNEAGPAAGYVSIPAAVIVGQALLETGNFTSAVFTENNNAFGLKLPSQRPTLATGENRGHATFNSVADSVVDYAMRQQYFGIPDGDVEQYMRATVASGYATDPGYLTKWLAKIPADDAPTNAGAIEAGIALLLLAIPAQR